MRQDELVSAADRNFIGSFAKLAAHQPGGVTRTVGTAFAFVTGLAPRIFNGVVITQPVDRSDLAEAVAWVRGHDVRHQLWVRDDLGRDAGAWTGYAEDPWVEPAMAIRPPQRTPEPRTGLTVHEVIDAASLERVVTLQVDQGVSEDLARAIFSPALAEDPDVRIFLASLAGKPAGNAIAIRSGGIAGVYAVGTRPEARRHGVGTAATWAAVKAGRDWGAPWVVLQASQMGAGVYRAMGFRQLNRFRTYRAPETGAPQR